MPVHRVCTHMVQVDSFIFEPKSTRREKKKKKKTMITLKPIIHTIFGLLTVRM